MPLRILLVSIDPSLIKLREMILLGAGYEVVSATNLLQVIDAYDAGDFDLVLIGHSINGNEKRRIATNLRDLGTRAEVLEMCLVSPEIPNVDHWIVESGPHSLLEKINEILSSVKGKTGNAQDPVTR